MAGSLPGQFDFTVGAPEKVVLQLVVDAIEKVFNPKGPCGVT